MAPKGRTSRRDFLKGKAAADALADLADQTTGSERAGPSGADPSTPSTQREGASYLFQIGRSAMACRFQIYLNAGQHEHAPEVALEALDLVEMLEDQMTVYRSHSELSQVNRTAAHGAVRIERGLLELLELASEISAMTGGAFDITSAPLVKVWKRHRREGEIPRQEDLDAALQCVGGRWLDLDREAATVRFLRPGVAIDLGGIGKGYALDRCGQKFDQAGVENYLIHGGHSSVLARGTRAGRAEEDAGWTVALRHPLRSGQRLAEIRLQDGALGTSGSSNQFFHYRGRRYGHVLDPRTGWPAEGVLSSTVLAPTAAQADALATATFVMGLEPTRQLLRGRDQWGALLVCPGQRQGSIEIHTIGLEDSDWRRVSS